MSIRIIYHYYIYITIIYHYIIETPTISFTPPDTLAVNVDATFPLQNAHDAGDVPPSIPPKHFSNDDALLLCKLPENRELQGNAPLTCSPKANQKDTTIPLLPPNMNQQNTVSDQMSYPTIYSKK